MPGHHTNLDNSRSTVHEVVAGGSCLDIFFLFLITSLYILPLSVKQRESTEIRSQRAVKPKTTSQPKDFLFA